MLAQPTPISSTQATQPRRRSLQASAHPTPIFAELVHSLRTYTQARRTTPPASRSSSTLSK